MSSRIYPRVLSIAGSDPSGGAGIQADIKACSACGAYAATAITALVDENTAGVYGVHAVPYPFVAAQIRSVLDDIGADAIKIGMLHSAALIATVTEVIDSYPELPPVVLDPVMVATSGDPLLEPDAVGALASLLIPRARVITPNRPEAAMLFGREAANHDNMTDVARELARRFEGVAVYLKGGHNDGVNVTDVLVDGDAVYEFTAPRIDTVNTHGTGCTLSSAIAAFLARGMDLPDACSKGHDYVHSAIRAGAAYTIGHGHGPVHHFHALWPR